MILRLQKIYVDRLAMFTNIPKCHFLKTTWDIFKHKKFQTLQLNLDITTNTFIMTGSEKLA